MLKEFFYVKIQTGATNKSEIQIKIVTIRNLCFALLKIHTFCIVFI